jgi:hypothetical protein
MGSGREVSKNTSFIRVITNMTDTFQWTEVRSLNTSLLRLMGFEPPSRTIHSITRQCQCDHDYCAPAFSQVNVLLNTVVIGVKCELVNIADDLISQLRI